MHVREASVVVVKDDDEETDVSGSQSSFCRESFFSLSPAPSPLLFLSFCCFLFTLRRVGRHEGHRLARCITGSSTDEQSTSYLSANTSRKKARRDFYDSERWPTFSNLSDRFSITNRAVVSVASDKVSIHRFSITVNLPALFSRKFNNRLSRRFSLAYSIASSSPSSLFYLCYYCLASIDPLYHGRRYKLAKIVKLFHREFQQKF